MIFKNQIIPGIGLLLLYIILAPAVFLCLDEDPYISFRFIDNFIAGNGLVFNAGDRIEGFSNLLWMILLYPFQVLGFSLTVVSRLMGMLLSILVAWRVVCFTRKLTGDNFLFSWAAGYWYLLSLPVLWWSQCGLETSLAALVIINTVYFSLYGSHRRFWGGVWLVASILTRPEAHMMIPFYGYFLLRSYPWQKALRGFCWVILVIVLYHCLRYGYYGQLLSNPAYVKAGGGFNRGLAYLWSFFFEGTYFIGLPIFIFALWGRSYLKKYLPLALVVFAYLFFNLYVGGDYKPHFRFMVPFLAPFIIVSTCGAYRLTNCFKAGKTVGVCIRASFIILIIVNLLSYKALDERAWNTFRKGLDGWPSRVAAQIQTAENGYDISYMPYLGMWIRDTFPPGTLIAYEQMGAVPYFSGIEYEYIDLGGLENRFIAHYYRDRRPGALLRFVREILDFITLHKRSDFLARTFAKFSKPSQRNPQEFIDYILKRKPEIVMTVGHLSKLNPWKRLYSNPAFRKQYRLAQSFGFRPGVYAWGKFEYDVGNTLMFFRNDLDVETLSKAKCFFEGSSHDDYYHYTEKAELIQWVKRKFPELVDAIR